MVGGTGISTKSFLSSVAGLPLVTNEAGLAGLCFGQESRCKSIFTIAETTTEFADVIHDLFKYENVWRQYSQKMLQHANVSISSKTLNRESKLKGLLRKLSLDRCKEKSTKIRPEWLQVMNVW